MSRVKLTCGTLLLAALALSACKAKEKPMPADTTATMAPAPAPAATPSASIEVGRAIGPDKRVLASLGEFKTRDTIYASVTTTNAPASGQLVATWTHESGQTVKVDTQSVAGPAQTAEFHISKKSAWPAGKYKVAVALDGQGVGEKEFEVK
ncbi:MAG TPA: hypothetical protein VFX50_08665 [Gemmatimonadales bacterium]|nr:hypothetical protein [Gemmatimonadales bacterium]